MKRMEAKPLISENTELVLTKERIALAVILIIACVPVPKDSWLDLSPFIKHIIILAITLPFFFLDFKKNILSIGKYDLLFLVFIFWNFLSFQWAINPSFIWRPAFSWVFAYVLFKFFQLIKIHISHKEFTIRLIQILSMTIVVMLFWHLLTMYLKIGSFDAYKISKVIHHNLPLSKNYYAVALVMMLPFSLMFKSGEKKYNALLLLSVFIQIQTIFLLHSRGSTIGTILMLGLFLYLNKFQKWINFKFILIFLLGILITFSAILSQIEDKQSFLDRYNPFVDVMTKSGDDRLKLWVITKPLIEERPIYGNGAGNWPVIYMKNGISELNLSNDSDSIYAQPHNFFIHTTSELGFIGLLLLLAIFIIPLIQYKTHSNPLILFSFLMIIVFMFCANFYGIIYRHYNVLSVHQIFLAMAFAVLMSHQQSPSPTDNSLRNYCTILLVVILGFSNIIWFAYGYNNQLIYQQFRENTKIKNWSKALGKIQSLYNKNFNTVLELKQPIKSLEANMNAQLNNTDEVLQNYKDAIVDHPYHYPTLLNQARYNFKLKKKQKARIILKEILRINKDYIKATLTLAEIAISKKEWNVAEHWLYKLTFIDEYMLLMETPKWKGVTERTKNRFKNYHKRMEIMRRKINKSRSNE